MSAPSISADRLLADIEALAAIGGRPDGGVDRLAGSPADREARRWFAARLTAAGLVAETDAVGNVFGRPSLGDRFLLLGSHTDTVPAGGRLDGAYGCLAALEAVRTLQEAGHPAAGRVAVADFHNEEGVVPTGFDGSEAFCAGPWLGSVGAYLELHIEQGPRLEAEGLDLAVVEGIVGIDRYRILFEGAANHAGTTPFSLRRDAGRAAARFLAGLRDRVVAVDPEAVANAGSITFSPGAPNVVPGRAEISLELRSLDPEVLSRLGRELAAEAEAIAAEERCAARLEPVTSWPAQRLDAGVIAALETVCARSGRWRRLVSGAGHDAEILARHVPAGMLFVPSRAGISHSPEEHTDAEHLALGCQVLLEGALAVLELMVDRPPS